MIRNVTYDETWVVSSIKKLDDWVHIVHLVSSCSIPSHNKCERHTFVKHKNTVIELQTNRICQLTLVITKKVLGDWHRLRIIQLQLKSEQHNFLHHKGCFSKNCSGTVVISYWKIMIFALDNIHPPIRLLLWSSQKSGLSVIVLCCYSLRSGCALPILAFHKQRLIFFTATYFFTTMVALQ